MVPRRSLHGRWAMYLEGEEGTLLLIQLVSAGTRALLGWVALPADASLRCEGATLVHVGQLDVCGHGLG